MKKFDVLATTYTSKGMGEIDIKAFRDNSAFRYRQDIFPNPTEFGLKIMTIVPEIVETGDAIYPYRLKLTVFCPDTADDKAIAAYKTAINNKTRRFDIVRTPVAKPPVVKKQKTEAASAPAEKEPKVKTKSKQRRKKK